MFLQRSSEKELMDLERANFEESKLAYQFMEKVNRFLGGTRAILYHLSRFSKNWPEEREIRILDLGTGGGDIPRAVLSWAKKKKLRVRIVALDIHWESLSYSREESRQAAGLHWIQADLGKLPFREKSFDYVMASMVFHHLADEEAVQILKEMNRLARHGVIVSDLLRNARAYLWILALSRLTKSRLVRYDAPLSVLRGFKRREVEAIREEAALGYLKFRRHFAHRFSLAGQRNGN